ncbi:MAG: PilT/PilU family type 4a pilus ATPase [Bdellovibrionales bacterium]|nr:PilT/PilU family type 4a pilus ATPase [Bdellovibrionales bacterium]
MGARDLRIARVEPFHLDTLFRRAVTKGASDLYIKSGNFPIVRSQGRLEVLTYEFGSLTSEIIEKILTAELDNLSIHLMKQKRNFDFSMERPGVGRFRVNASLSRGDWMLSVRIIGVSPMSLEELNLPTELKKFTRYQRGLVLISGKAGAGKSTTMASLLNYMVNRQNRHVITLEDPVEYQFTGTKGIVTQKELGRDVATFADGLKAALRQNPDALFIGEMRDRETIEAALVAAETGHLVFSTLHSGDAPGVVHRILAAFPCEQHGQVRRQLAANLMAVVSQRLVPSIHRNSVMPAVEILVVNDRIQELIRNSERTHEIIHAIEEGFVNYGMQTFDQSLLSLLTKELIDYQTALAYASRPADFELRCSGVKATDGDKWVPFDLETEGTPDRFSIDVKKGDVRMPEYNRSVLQTRRKTKKKKFPW